MCEVNDVLASPCFNRVGWSSDEDKTTIPSFEKNCGLNYSISTSSSFFTLKGCPHLIKQDHEATTDVCQKHSPDSNCSITCFDRPWLARYWLTAYFALLISFILFILKSPASHSFSALPPPSYTPHTSHPHTRMLIQLTFNIFLPISPLFTTPITGDIPGRATCQLHCGFIPLHIS